MSLKRGRPPQGIAAKDRFWPRVKKTSSCWEWDGYSANGRYGHFQVGGVRIPVHVWSYMVDNNLSERPKLKVLHKCDNPKCVRPSHLFLGSQLDNVRDRDAKKRQRYMENAPAKGVVKNANDTIQN